MLKELIKSLNSTKAQVAALEAKVEKGLQKTLASIHAEHGFDSVDSFIEAVKGASKKAEAKGREVGKIVLPRAKRAKITAAVRETVKNLVKTGKSAAEIATAAGISSASVQNVKKALGLVKPAKKVRGKATKKTAPLAPAKAKTAPKTGKKRAPAAPAPVRTPTETPAITGPEV